MAYSYDYRTYSYDRRADTEEDTERRLESLGRLVKGLADKEAEYLQKKDDWGTQISAGALVRAIYHVAVNKTGARQLFWTILQTYKLEPKDRKIIEQANRFFAKNQINRIKPEKAMAAYNKMLSDFRLYYETAERALHNIKHSDEESGTSLRAGSFTLVNTGGFPDKTMQDVSKVVLHADRLLRAKGLSRVCYGNLQVTNTIGRSTRVLAFYVQSSDEMFVRANLKGKQAPALTSVLHELGHRLHYKFLSGKNAEIRGIYQTLAGKESEILRSLIYDRSKIPAPGATLKGDKNEVWVSDGETFFKGTQMYLKIHLESDPARRGGIALSDWFLQQGMTSFVSLYAKKNHEENFAEMIAAYCEDRLPADQVMLLESVL